MLKVFKALESSGLRGFLGCSTAIYEVDLLEFFDNAKVESDTVVKHCWGNQGAITEEIFTDVFQLPTEELIIVTELPERMEDAQSESSQTSSKSSAAAEVIFVEFQPVQQFQGIEESLKAPLFYPDSCSAKRPGAQPQSRAVALSRASDCFQIRVRSAHDVSGA
ncbi:hypothetical protein F511_35362 [Dorcoceras hygrometricum]|uniref:Uncharacterized protein n=1 Tax=Dorcoceras hygrometricum TaxID=472368 RepID=A0A2Z7ALR4_9LAMI|nr:hypothetical protein F511_35362 [Dorcoceras hygrometricum]